MRKVMGIHDGKFQCECIYDEKSSPNPYKLYKIYWTPGEYGYKTHRKLIVKYGNFESVLAHIWQDATGQQTGSTKMF